MAFGFDRVPMEHRPMLEAARSLIPAKAAALVSPRYLVGYSPRFVGLHDHTDHPNLAGTGYTLEDCAHACFGWAYGEQVIAFPRPRLYDDPIATLIHEIGHMFDEATGFSLDAPETTAYSRTNRIERIAEAFETVITAEHYRWGDWQERTSTEAFRPLREAMGV